MKKLLLSASKIALAFSFILHTAYAMEDENLDMDVDVTKKIKRKADALENNRVTKKQKITEVTFPLEKLFPVLEKYYFPNELKSMIVMALPSEGRKVYSQVLTTG